MFSSLKRIYLERGFEIMFYSTLVTLALAPIFTALGVERGTILLLFGGNQAIALAVSRGRVLKFCLLPLLASVMALSGALPAGDLVELTALAVLIFLAFAVVVLSFLSALRTKRVEAENIYAALNAYLFLGICLGITYWLVERFQPGSFAFARPEGPEVPLSTMLYFSFVTLSTTGYGDISPVTEITRSLAVAEAVTGQLFLAATLARLVSVYSTSRT